MPSYLLLKGLRTEPSESRTEQPPEYYARGFRTEIWHQLLDQLVLRDARVPTERRAAAGDAGQRQAVAAARGRRSIRAFTWRSIWSWEGGQTASLANFMR